MLRRVTSESEAELSPDGHVENEGIGESESKIGCSELNARGSHDNNKKERFYEYLVMAGRRGGGGWGIKMPSATLLYKTKRRCFSKT